MRFLEAFKELAQGQTIRRTSEMIKYYKKGITIYTVYPSGYTTTNFGRAPMFNMNDVLADDWEVLK